MQMFELPEKAVVNKISQMIMAEELEGSWDQPTRTVHLHALQPTRLQLLAMQVGACSCSYLPCCDRKFHCMLAFMEYDSGSDPVHPAFSFLCAMQYSDKLTVLIDVNERALADRTGGLGLDTGGGGGGGGGRHRGKERDDRERGDFGGGDRYGGGWGGGRGRGGERGGRRGGSSGHYGSREGGYRGEGAFRGGAGSTFHGRRGEGGRNKGGDSRDRMVSLGRGGRY